MRAIKNKLTTPLLVKTFCAFLIVIVVFPVILLTWFLSNVDNSYISILSSKIIALISVAIIISIGTFELTKNFKHNKGIIVLGIFLQLIFLIIPLVYKKHNLFEVKAFDFSTTENTFVNLIKQQLKFWPSYLGMAFYSLIASCLKKNKSNFTIEACTLFTFLTIISLFARFFWIINLSSLYGIFLIILTAMFTDSFGLFGGKFFGNKFFKQKLAPQISPNKTIEGSIIGYALSLSITLVLTYFTLIDLNLDFTLGWVFWTSYVTISITLPLMSILGDVFFSSLKRYLKIKDFSNLIKGHGGLFDRLDSMCFSAITFIFVIAAVDSFNIAFII